MEEANEWRRPIDLVGLLAAAFDELPAALASGRDRQRRWRVDETVVPCLLSDEPRAIVACLVEALREGCPAVELAGLVAYAAALRIARFPTSNEFRDWDTALHSFTFANAVQQGLRALGVAGAIARRLRRGDERLSQSLSQRPRGSYPGSRRQSRPRGGAAKLPALLNQRHEVNAASQLVVQFVGSGGDPDRFLAVLGGLLLREDRDFHTIQTLEAAFRQYGSLRGAPAGTHMLIAAARYLAAHSPTMRRKIKPGASSNGCSARKDPDETPV